LAPPEDTVRTGFYLHNRDMTWMRAFSAEELLRGVTGADGVTYAGYANVGDYFQRLSAAATALVESGLYNGPYGAVVTADLERAYAKRRRFLNPGDVGSEARLGQEPDEPDGP